MSVHALDISPKKRFFTHRKIFVRKTIKFLLTELFMKLGQAIHDALRYFFYVLKL